MFIRKALFTFLVLQSEASLPSRIVPDDWVIDWRWFGEWWPD